MKAIIEKLEALTKWDRALDQEIARVVENRTLPGRPAWGTPYYTRSVDAAMRLIPEGACLELSTYPRDAEDTKPIAIVSHPLDGGTTWQEGATPALAICIAALKARYPNDV